MNNYVASFEIGINKGIGRREKDTDVLLGVIIDQDAQMFGGLWQDHLFFPKN